MINEARMDRLLDEIDADYAAGRITKQEWILARRETLADFREADDEHWQDLREQWS